MGHLATASRIAIGLVVAIATGTTMIAAGGELGVSDAHDPARAQSSSGALDSLVPDTTPPATRSDDTPPAAPPTSRSATGITPSERGDQDLAPGDTGPEVAELQERLVGRGFWLGTPDGAYGELTAQAVLAFQKAEGIERDGIADTTTRDRLAEAARPAPRGTGETTVEIDLDRQLLLIVRNGAVEWVLNTSTGTPETPTRPGRSEVKREIDDVRRAPLGDLYRPRYFDGGIAVPGADDVPAQPASHGCARISDSAMDLLWSTDTAAVGSSVWVY